jgi:hypothetical protein
MQENGWDITTVSFSPVVVRWKAYTYSSAKRRLGTVKLLEVLSVQVDTLSRRPGRKRLRAGLSKKQRPTGKPLDRLT